MNDKPNWWPDFEKRFTRSGHDECWEWLGAARNGYGVFSLGGRPIPATHAALLPTHGAVPKGFEVDHLCRNHSCVNPSHLEIVTRFENRSRGSKARLGTGRYPKTILTSLDTKTFEHVQEIAVHEGRPLGAAVRRLITEALSARAQREVGSGAAA